MALVTVYNQPTKLVFTSGGSAVDLPLNLYAQAGVPNLAFLKGRVGPEVGHKTGHPVTRGKWLVFQMQPQGPRPLLNLMTSAGLLLLPQELQALDLDQNRFVEVVAQADVPADLFTIVHLVENRRPKRSQAEVSKR